MIQAIVLLALVGACAILVLIGIELMKVERRILALNEQLRDLDGEQDLEERG